MSQNDINASVTIAEDKQDDSVVRFLFENHGVRGEIVHMHEPVRKLLENINHYPDSVKGLMLDLAAAAVLIAATLKANGTVTVQIQGGKGSRSINFAFVNIDKNLNFYGNVSYENKDLQGASFSELVGDGGILVISAFPEGGSRYQGIVALDKNTLAEALETYFKDSEQLDTSILLAHDCASFHSGGIMLQIIPNIEGNHESLQHLTTLAATLSKEELFDLSLHESLRRLFWNDQIRVFDPEDVAFKCICSHERILNAINGLPRMDLEEISEDPNGINMSCNSCGKNYHVTQEEIKELLKRTARDEVIHAAQQQSARQKVIDDEALAKAKKEVLDQQEAAKKRKELEGKIDIVE